MNGGRTKFDPPPGLTAKPNRLRRSFRRTQQTAAEGDSPKSQQSEFKTPTRIPRSRAGGGFSGESPQNDSDVQQDIIWDATSPSPSRAGKRGKKHPGVVDISEIVSRIAPKHGRPEVTEPALQRWIGDSAALPCTPHVPAPKARRKSPRTSGVDDLLKLAKQFDLNLFHQEVVEEQQEEQLQHHHQHQQSLQLLPDDVSSPSLPGSCRRAVDLQDDLDFLFDGPTQRVSGRLSPPSQVTPAAQEASGKPVASSRGFTSGVSTMTIADEFEDDWENDDLLNDSLVLEMTQDPQKFSAPKLCSTQKPPGDARPQGPGTVPDQSAAPVRPRTTFKLESNPIVSGRRTQNPQVERDALQDRGPSTASPDPLNPPFHPSVEHTTAQRFPQAPAVLSARTDPPDQDQDLDSFFSSDPVWDDPADDHLLCELCEDVENQIQNAEPRSVGRERDQRPALRPANRTWISRSPRPANQQPARPANQQPAPPTPTAPSCPPGFRATTSRTCLQPNKDRFTFKKPKQPVPTATGQVVGKCSAAEIELKKQQAMERRRQRLQAAQHLRAPPDGDNPTWRKQPHLTELHIKTHAEHKSYKPCSSF